jgi:hypothetical protein
VMMICVTINCCFALWWPKVAFLVFTKFPFAHFFDVCWSSNRNWMSIDKPW